MVVLLLLLWIEQACSILSGATKETEAKRKKVLPCLCSVSGCVVDGFYLPNSWTLVCYIRSYLFVLH